MESIGRIVVLRINVNQNGMEIVAIQKILLAPQIVHHHLPLDDGYIKKNLIFLSLNKFVPLLIYFKKQTILSHK